MPSCVLLPLAHLRVVLEGLPVPPREVEFWLPLDPRGRVRLICPDCRREARVLPEVVEKGEVFRCPFCLQEVSVAEALVLTYPKVLKPALAAAASYLEVELNRLLGGRS